MAQGPDEKMDPEKIDEEDFAEASSVEFFVALVVGRAALFSNRAHLSCQCDACHFRKWHMQCLVQSRVSNSESGICNKQK